MLILSEVVNNASTQGAVIALTMLINLVRMAPGIRQQEHGAYPEGCSCRGNYFMCLSVLSVMTLDMIGVTSSKKIQVSNGLGPQKKLILKDKGVIDSGFSRHMIGNKSYLIDYEEIDGGFVAFGGIENLIDLKVKVIRYDNGTEFKNRVMNQFCEMKGIKREFSVARTPQQNRVAERKNRTLIEAARLC
ncbi:putative ribonuclease H-like domain-containing protein [Tanacetum coccineum]